MPAAPFLPVSAPLRRLITDDDGSYNIITSRVSLSHLAVTSDTTIPTKHGRSMDYNGLDLARSVMSNTATLSRAFASSSKKLGILEEGDMAAFTSSSKSIPLARKSIKFDTAISRDVLETLRRGFSIGESLKGHHHNIKVIGTYWKGPSNLNILTFPVAECDLAQFLDDCEK